MDYIEIDCESALNHLKRKIPYSLYQKLSNLYQSGSVGKEYKDEFYQMFHE